MKELFEKLESRVVTHMWDIERDVAEHDGFRCHQQIDDLKDCLCIVKTMHEVLAMPAISLK